MSDVETKSTEEDAAESGDGAQGEEVRPEEAVQEPPPDPLAELQAERDKYRDQLLRTAADFDNYRKRTRKDAEQAERRGKEDILRELLPVFDNLERAVHAATGASDVKSIVEGVEMVLKLFDDTTARMGLERVESVGQRFDPSLHEAFQQVATNEHPPGTIIAEYQSGFRLGDRLIRPAMVVVSRKPDPPPDGQDGTT